MGARMKRIARSAIVEHSAAEMYALVEDIEAYPQFLPWCAAAEVHERRPGATKATLTVGLGALRHAFTTLNENRPGEAIDMRLVEGPFRRFYGAVALRRARPARLPHRVHAAVRVLQPHAWTAARAALRRHRRLDGGGVRATRQPRFMKVEVVFARPEGADAVSLNLPAAATVRDALAASGFQLSERPNHRDLREAGGARPSAVAGRSRRDLPAARHGPQGSAAAPRQGKALGA